ncbi:MAG: 16S rRNA (cytosine(1402)-N(4))-methyltransferase [Desulfobacteraceae bacterium 4572_130]|nr:MAG: 16S rRNA (cytosine(1402)-N(4))-methyltransferase [Desulfobacteraceae bacterium 4572_130]
MTFKHTPVMLEQTQEYLNLKPGDICVDCTLGGSSHAAAIIQKILPKGKFIGIDQDIDAVKNAKKVLAHFPLDVLIFHDNFSALPSILESLKITGVNGIFLDLGLSLHQLKKSKRGFSFQKNEPLDMRMNTNSSITALDIINNYSENELANIFFKYGEESMSRKIARNIIRARKKNFIKTTKNFVDIVQKTIPIKIAVKQKIHPATRVFQALRIAVNKELYHLRKFMKNVPDFLNKGGRLCVISFHSLEDRIVKQSIKSFEQGCTCPSDFPKCVCKFQPKLKSIFKKPLIPLKKEIQLNPMARSAKFRVAQRI